MQNETGATCGREPPAVVTLNSKQHGSNKMFLHLPQYV